MALVVQSSLRTAGLEARNGVTASQAYSQARAACGYFLPPRRGGEGGQGVEGGLGRRRGADRPQFPGDLGGVAAGRRPQRAADQVDVMPTSA
jgi:hypothetical protein